MENQLQQFKQWRCINLWEKKSLCLLARITSLVIQIVRSKRKEAENEKRLTELFARHSTIFAVGKNILYLQWQSSYPMSAARFHFEVDTLMLQSQELSMSNQWNIQLWAGKRSQPQRVLHQLEQWGQNSPDKIREFNYK